MFSLEKESQTIQYYVDFLNVIIILVERLTEQGMIEPSICWS